MDGKINKKDSHVALACNTNEEERTTQKYKPLIFWATKKRKGHGVMAGAKLTAQPIID